MPEYSRSKGLSFRSRKKFSRRRAQRCGCEFSYSYVVIKSRKENKKVQISIADKISHIRRS